MSYTHRSNRNEETSVVNSDTKVTRIEDDGNATVSRKDNDGNWNEHSISGVTGINVTR